MIRARLLVLLAFALYLRWGQEQLLMHQRAAADKVRPECEYALARINFYESKPQLNQELKDHDKRK